MSTVLGYVNPLADIPVKLFNHHLSGLATKSFNLNVEYVLVFPSFIHPKETIQEPHHQPTFV